MSSAPKQHASMYVHFFAQNNRSRQPLARAHPEYRGFLNPKSRASWRGSANQRGSRCRRQCQLNPAPTRLNTCPHTQMRIINQPARFAMSKQGLQLLLREGMSLLYLLYGTLAKTKTNSYLAQSTCRHPTPPVTQRKKKHVR